MADSTDIDITFGGLCPVEGYADLGGRGLYFRARHESWSVTIGEPDPRGNYVDDEGADLFVVGPSDDPSPFSAGYMEHDEARRHVGFAVAAYRAGVRGVVELPDWPSDAPPCVKCGAKTTATHPAYPALPWCAGGMHGSGVTDV